MLELNQQKHRRNRIKDVSSGRLFDNGITVEWLSTKEASKFLSITPNALRIMVCRNQIKAYKFRSRLRFRLIDLLDHLQIKEV